MNARFAAAIVTCLIASPALAEPVEYVIDPTHSFVMFEAERFGFNKMIGLFTDISGSIVLDEADPAASHVSASVRTASLFSANALREEHITGERWLDAAAFPEITFTSTEVRPTSETTADVLGMMTLRGVEQPVTFTVTLNRLALDPATRRASAGLSIEGSVDRTEFGVALVPALIGNDIPIRMEIMAHAAEAE